MDESLPSPLTPEELIQYQAARAGAAFTLTEQSGLIEVSGRDRVEFFQNKSANDLRRLAPDLSVLSPLLTPTGRIRDVLRLLVHHDTLWALTLPGRGETTLAFLRSQIFFRDQVSLADRSREFLQIDLDGPEANRVLDELGLSHPPVLDEVEGLRFEGEQVTCMGHPGLLGPGVKMLVPTLLAPAMSAKLTALGATRLSAPVYDAMRVEAGLPGPLGELTPQYTPFEAGLEWTVSADKGCYTGQEVLARQHNYDKIVHRLAGLALSEAAPIGARLWVEGRPAGTLTSAAHSPRFGLIGLGILRREHLAPGTSLQVGAADSQASARVVALPFDGR